MTRVNLSRIGAAITTSFVVCEKSFWQECRIVNLFSGIGLELG